jgi:hypothetical protein
VLRDNRHDGVGGTGGLERFVRDPCCDQVIGIGGADDSARPGADELREMARKVIDHRTAEDFSPLSLLETVGTECSFRPLGKQQGLLRPGVMDQPDVVKMIAYVPVKSGAPDVF